MTLPRRSSFVLLALLAAALVPLGRASERIAPGFTVHEWGTFTTVAAADGRPLPWRPFEGAQDLPSFVYSMRAGKDSLAFKARAAALARLETPVLYFYADEPLTASVTARFPSGLLTEWYPQARSSASQLDWPRVEVRPGEASAYPTEPAPSHYYHARRAEAAPLVVRTGDGLQREGFLFYRGVGSIQVPLRVASAEGRWRVDRLPEGPAEIIVFESQDGRVAWSRETLGPESRWIERPPARDVEELQAELAATLTAEGLFEREAEAMVATWADSWFEEGARVFYVMPRAQVDAVLPLRVEPAPRSVARVMVGRIELITPARLDALEAWIVALDEPALATGLDETRRSLGRFAQPLLRELLARDPQGRAAERVRRLLAGVRT